MIYIIAKDRRQYLYWCKKNRVDPHWEARFVDGAHYLRGVHRGQFLMVGTFYDRRDWREIEQVLLDILNSRPDTFTEWRNPNAKPSDETVRDDVRDAKRAKECIEAFRELASPAPCQRVRPTRGTKADKKGSRES